MSYSQKINGSLYNKLTVTLFPWSVDFGPVTLSHFGFSIAGENFTLTCSASLTVKPGSQQSSGIPSSPYDWFFGPNNSSLPSGVTSVATNNRNTFTSTLQFSPLIQSHAGIYTCQLGAGRLANSVNISVNGIILYITDDDFTYLHIDFFSQHHPSLSRSLLVELQCWDKMATPSLVLFMELKISIPL